MCGHIGCIGDDITVNDLRALEQGARTLIVRGQDGSGILQGRFFDRKRPKSRFTVEKSKEEMGPFLDFHAYGKGGDRDILNQVYNNFNLIHVRAATKGTLTDENAHPFECGKIIGMHNGTLDNSDYRSIGGKTDSEAMFNDINENGFQVLGNLHKDSAYAIVAWNKETGQIHIARNHLRTLFCTWSTDRRVFWYASESDHLQWILARNGLKHGDVFKFKEETLYTFLPTGVRKGKCPEWTLEPIQKKISPTTRLPWRHTGGNRSNSTPLTSSSLNVECIICQRWMGFNEQAKGKCIDAFRKMYICKKCDEFDDAKQGEILIN